MKLLIISVFSLFINQNVFSQNDKILYNAGVDIMLSLNSQVFTNINIKNSPSPKLIAFASITLKKSIYLEIFGSPNLIDVDNNQLNIFDDFGVLAGINIQKNKNSFNVAFGSYYRSNLKSNYKYNGYRIGLTGKIKVEFQLWKALSAGLVFRQFTDVLKNNELLNQSFLSQTALGLTINSNLNEIYLQFKKKRKPDFY